MEFYFKRAASTRISSGVELAPPRDVLEKYSMYMDHLFAQRAPPSTFDMDDILLDGNLRQNIFHRAVAQLNPTSTPGFPFFNISANSQLNMLDLYTEVNQLLKRWLAYEEGNDDPVAFFRAHLAPPAHVFIKSEPTRSDKVARLIYGVSVLTNVIARILFGDYLLSLTDSWYTASHKVGLDFSSPEGLELFRKSLVPMVKTSRASSLKVISDDIQGWEYQVRSWMQEAWHASYLKRAQATSFHRKLQNVYALVERNTLVRLSSGELIQPPFYFRMSGVVTTHIQNSDERAALAMLDLSHEFELAPNLEELYTVTNGDDCLRLSTNATSDYSRTIGFVHTDRVVQDLQVMFNFCSQQFFYEDGALKRFPDTLVKTAFTLLSVDDYSDPSTLDVILHAYLHPKFRTLMKLVHSLRRVPGTQDM